jgi:hypothetical protein
VGTFVSFRGELCGATPLFPPQNAWAVVGMIISGQLVTCHRNGHLPQDLSWLLTPDERVANSEEQNAPPDPPGA